MDFFIAVLICLCSLFPVITHASILCGDFTCHGVNPYCCTLDDGNIGCCWNTYVYEFWWFWFIWVVLFFIILSCSFAIWRRRRRAVRYVVMANSEYPTYGTVVHSSSTVTSAPAPSAPVNPPSYAASEASKPPAYSG